VVPVPASTDLRRLAPKAGLSVETLRTLNPVLIRAITPPGAPYQLRVPVGARSSVLTALAPPAKPHPAPVVTRARARHASLAADEDVHIVQPRDTVSSIAKQHGVKVTDMLRWNRLEEGSRIRPGDRLRVADSRPPASEGQGGFR
jgi:membrane-bound lytic murein transglycosylase D